MLHGCLVVGRDLVDMEGAGSKCDMLLNRVLGMVASTFLDIYLFFKLPATLFLTNSPALHYASALSGINRYCEFSVHILSKKLFIVEGFAEGNHWLLHSMS